MLVVVAATGLLYILLDEGYERTRHSDEADTVAAEGAAGVGDAEGAGNAGIGAPEAGTLNAEGAAEGAAGADGTEALVPVRVS